jgi:predicted membrane channel-forming protein YqfA (hemolysin III family)
MQKIATKIFIGASIVFGIAGILMVFTMPPDGIDAHASMFNKLMMRTLMAMVFVILPSFALSLASKYFNK